MGYVNKGETMSHDLKRLLESALPDSVEWAGLRRVRTAARGYRAKDGKFDSAFDSLDEGCMIEVLHQGQFGYAALASLDICRAANRRSSSTPACESRGSPRLIPL